jgi:hypothetical protein
MCKEPFPWARESCKKWVRTDCHIKRPPLNKTWDSNRLCVCTRDHVPTNTTNTTRKLESCWELQEVQQKAGCQGGAPQEAGAAIGGPPEEKKKKKKKRGYRVCSSGYAATDTS